MAKLGMWITLVTLIAATLGYGIATLIRDRGKGR